MRSRRERAGSARVVAVTGTADGLGRAVLERLGAREATAGLRDVDTLVHLDITYDAHADPNERRARNVHGTAALLEVARAARVSRVVLVTSADVYGAVVGNAVPLPDDAPVRATAGDDLLGDHVEVERLAASARGLRVATIRPATVVGGRFGASYDGALLRQLSAPRLLAARGTEPLWQLCHADDLVRAIEVVVASDLDGPLPVACEGAMPQAQVERMAGKRRVELPASIALGTAERLHRLGVSTASPRELDHLLAPVVVASARLREAGWSPQWTNEAALAAHLAERSRAGGRTGAYTAAGATVALLGTAALVRQARRRRRP
jgi:nucleoside-diphosphate-sugar epimerase